MPRHLESTTKLILEDNIKNNFKRKLSLYLSLYFALFEFPFIFCWTWLHEPGDGAKLCYYSSRWSAVPNFCSQATQKSYFFIQIICSTLWLLQVQSSGLPSIFLTAQPQPTFYLISKTFQGLLTLQGFYPSMTTFLAAFFLASSSPQKEFSRTKMAIGVFYSEVFFKKIQCSHV